MACRAQRLRGAGATEKPQQQTGGQGTNSTAEKQAARSSVEVDYRQLKLHFLPPALPSVISKTFLTFYARVEKRNLIVTWQRVSAINIKLQFSNKEKAAQPESKLQLLILHPNF